MPIITLDMLRPPKASKTGSKERKPIPRELAYTYAVYELSEMLPDSSGKVGYHTYPVFNLCMGAYGQVDWIGGWKYTDKGGDTVEMYVCRDDVHKTVLLRNSWDVPPDLMWTAISRYPEGP